jgi:hypothetical protein
VWSSILGIIGGITAFSVEFANTAHHRSFIQNVHADLRLKGHRIGQFAGSLSTACCLILLAAMAALSRTKKRRLFRSVYPRMCVALSASLIGIATGSLTFAPFAGNHFIQHGRVIGFYVAVIFITALCITAGYAWAAPDKRNSKNWGPMFIFQPEESSSNKASELTSSPTN